MYLLGGRRRAKQEPEQLTALRLHDIFFLFAERRRARQGAAALGNPFDQAAAPLAATANAGSRYFLPSSISITGMPLRIGYL